MHAIVLQADSSFFYIEDEKVVLLDCCRALGVALLRALPWNGDDSPGAKYSED